MRRSLEATMPSGVSRGEVMRERVNVFLYASDPISQTGIAGQLRVRPEVQLIEDGDIDRAEVAVMVVDQIDDEAVRVVQAIQRNGCPRVVMVVTHLDDTGLMAAVEAGVCGFLRRNESQPEPLVAVIVSAAAGNGNVPPDLLGRLLSNVSMVQQHVLGPRGLSFSGLTTREIDVLKLLAEGLDTSEVAHKLAYSERTVKNVLQDVTRRHNLRNRTHAVAYALRQGLI
jgi:DNA-binding NarL/FixJ family response regulator